MITRNNLPKGYIPYQTLEICSNKLIGGGHIVAVGDTLPVVIGKGVKPQVWLQAMSNPEAKEFISIVEASVSKHAAVEVKEEDQAIVVSVQGVRVLVVESPEETSAVVTQIDLRPLGLNLHGSLTSLFVGGSTFSGNSMTGGGILIGFGEPK